MRYTDEIKEEVLSLQALKFLSPLYDECGGLRVAVTHCPFMLTNHCQTLNWVHVGLGCGVEWCIFPSKSGLLYVT